MWRTNERGFQLNHAIVIVWRQQLSDLHIPYLINTVMSFFQCLSDYTGLSKLFAWQVFTLYLTLLEDMSVLKRSLSNLLRLKMNR